MIRAIIIEDEEIAAIRLQNMIKELDGSIVVSKHLKSVAQAAKYLNANEPPDLIFLDIHLSDSNSFEIFKQVEVHSPIIFTTAYSDYAIKAFDQNSIDYLLKPISKRGLEKALTKFKRFGNTDQVPDYRALFHEAPDPFRQRFLVKVNNTLQSVPVSEIAYFYSEDKVTFIRLVDGKSIAMDETLNALMEQLDPKKFFRINRKYLISIDSITRMYYTSKSRIQVDLEPEPKEANVMVSVERLGRFKKWLSL